MQQHLRIKCIYKNGEILDESLYERLKNLDLYYVFPGCGNEFKSNRVWWVIMDEDRIIAYAALAYLTDRVCLYVRAWVHKDYRGLGLQRRLIKHRIRHARQMKCKTIVTYTTNDNPASGNNLFHCGFRQFLPEYKYAGKEMVYYRKILS